MVKVLLPRPRSLEVTGTGPNARELEIRTVHEPAVPAQGYELTVDESGAEVRFSDEQGRRYGEQTLGQIVEHSHERLPSLRASDHPDFAVRGYMLDISRDRVPTRTTLERIVEIMSLVRLNHLQLYTEHTFAYSDHETVWRDASPMTTDDMRWLDELCAANGIELAANQNSFGHMERWLRHEPYRARAECPDGYSMMGAHRPPATLAPTPENAEFSLGLLRELLETVTSRRVNIGCDETFELGMGRSSAEVAERGKARVFCDHLLRITGPLASDGYEVLFWADMLRTNPELMDELPSSARAVAWTYESPSAGDEAAAGVPGRVARALAEMGIDLDAHRGFAENVRPLADAGIPFWVAPGTSSWNSLVGRLDNALANISDAADVGRRHGSEGLLLTDWGDNGHLQPPSVSILPIIHAGISSWCAQAHRDVDLASVADQYVFGDDAGVLGGVLERIGGLWRRTGRRTSNGSPLFAALFPHQFHFATGEPDAAKVKAVVEELEGALADLERARPRCADAGTIVRELGCAVRLARLGARRLIDQPGTADDLTGLIDEYRACWLERSRPGGLDDSSAHLQRTQQSNRHGGTTE